MFPNRTSYVEKDAENVDSLLLGRKVDTLCQSIEQGARLLMILYFPCIFPNMLTDPRTLRERFIPYLQGQNGLLTFLINTRRYRTSLAHLLLRQRLDRHRPTFESRRLALNPFPKNSHPLEVHFFRLEGFHARSRLHSQLRDPR